MEGQLNVDAAVFDPRQAKGCVDVAEQDCCRLPLVLTLRTITRSRGNLELWHFVQEYTTRPWINDQLMARAVSNQIMN